MDYVTLDQLKKALQQAVKNDILCLVPNLLNRGPFRHWVETLLDNIFRIENPIFTDQGTTAFTVTGQIIDRYSLPQYSPVSTVSEGTVTLTFSQSTLGSDISQELDWKGIVWALQGQNYVGTATLIPPGTLHFTWSKTELPPRPLMDYLNDFSSGYSNSEMGEGVPFLQSLTLIDLQSILSFDGLVSTTPALQLEPSHPPELLSLSDISFSEASVFAGLRLRNIGDYVDFEGSTYLECTVLLGEVSFQAQLLISSNPIWDFRLKSQEGLTLADLTGLIESLGYSTAYQLIETFLQTIPVSGLTVNQVAFRVNPSELTVQSASIQGTFVLFTGKISYELQLPSGYFYASLYGEKQEGMAVQYSGIPIQPILEHYLGVDSLFSATTVHTLLLKVDPPAKAYTLQIGVEGLVDINIGYTPVSLDRLELSLAQSLSDYSITGTLLACFTISDVLLHVEGSYLGDGQWAFDGGTDQGKISLVDFVNGALDYLGAELPATVPDTTIMNLRVAFSTEHQNFAFACETDTTVQIPFLTGDESRIYTDIFLKTSIDGLTGDRTLEGRMYGEFYVGDSQFTLEYDLNQRSNVFAASWRMADGGTPLGITTFLEAMGVVAEHSAFEQYDLKLTQAYLRYQAETQTLELVGNSEQYGRAFLVVSKYPLGEATGVERPGNENGDTWHYVVGWNYEDTTSFSQIPHLPGVWSNADVFHLTSVGVWISSDDIDSFEVPVLPPLLAVSEPDPRGLLEQLADEGDEGPTLPEAPKGNWEPVGARDVITIKRGINLVAEVDLAQNPENDPDLNALNTVLPTTRLTIFAAVDPEGARFSLTALVPGTLTIPTGDTSALAITNAQMVFAYDKTLSFKLSGDIVMTFDHVTVTATASIIIRSTGVVVLIWVDFGEGGWQEPMGIPSLVLHNVGFELGVLFSPIPRLDIGLEGTWGFLSEPVQIPEETIPIEASGDEPWREESRPEAVTSFAFVLEVIEEVPTPLLLRFYTDTMNVASIISTFVPHATADDLPTVIQETQFQKVTFYLAERRIQLPSGEWATAGFRFSGVAQVLDFQCYASVAIDPVHGISGEFTCSPIHLANILAVAGNGPGVFWDEVDGAPKQATVLPAPKYDAEADRIQLVTPGGPYLKFSTVRPPYLQLSAVVDFLDLQHYEIEALITDDEIQFQLDYDVGGIVRASIDFDVTSTSFYAHSLFGLYLKFDVGPIVILGVNLGKLRVDGAFYLEMEINASAEDFLMTIEGEFDFEGASLTIPKLTLHFSPQSLLELPDILAKWIREKAYDVFKDLFTDAKERIEAGFKAVEHLEEKAIGEAIALTSHAEAQVEVLVSSAIDTVGNDVEAVEAQVLALQNEAEEILTKAHDEVVKLEQQGEQAVQALTLEINNTVTAAEQEIELIAAQIEEEREQIAEDIEALAKATTQEVAAIARAIQKETEKLLRDAHRSAQKIINEAQKVADALMTEAQELWNTAKDLGRRISAGLAQVGHKGKKVAEKTWNTVSKY